jgi:hypothetical protein
VEDPPAATGRRAVGTTYQRQIEGRHSLRASVVLRLAAAGFLLVMAAAVAAEETQPPSNPPADPADSAPVPTPAEPPGLFGALRRWLDEKVTMAAAGLKDAQESIDEANRRARDASKDAIQDATTAITRLPQTSIVRGRELCELMQNGAPDCGAASITLCRSKGFETGQSLDVQSVDMCPGKVWLSGRKPNPEECTVDTFVTRVVCQ